MELVSHWTLKNLVSPYYTVMNMVKYLFYVHIWYGSYLAKVPPQQLIIFFVWSVLIWWEWRNVVSVGGARALQWCCRVRLPPKTSLPSLSLPSPHCSRLYGAHLFCSLSYSQCRVLCPLCFSGFFLRCRGVVVLPKVLGAAVAGAEEFSVHSQSVGGTRAIAVLLFATCRGGRR